MLKKKQDRSKNTLHAEQNESDLPPSQVYRRAACCNHGGRTERQINAKTSLCPCKEDVNSICPWPASTALLMSRSPAFKLALPEEGKGC